MLHLEGEFNRRRLFENGKTREEERLVKRETFRVRRNRRHSMSLNAESRD